jgi:hypothetical protein
VVQFLPTSAMISHRCGVIDKLCQAFLSRGNPGLTFVVVVDGLERRVSPFGDFAQPPVSPVTEATSMPCTCAVANSKSR